MDPVTRALLNSAGLVLMSTMLTAIAAWFWFTKNAGVKKVEQEKQAVVDEARRLASEHQVLMNRVRDLETQLVSVTQTVLPLSTAFQAILVKELTHYHTPVMDKLMEKIGPPNTLTVEEQQHLITLLEERTRDLNGRISESERDAAVMLPLVMKRARAEQEALLKAPVELKVVAVKPEDARTVAPLLPPSKKVGKE